MDPYLEGSFWMNLHLLLCTEIMRLLAPRVRPKYQVIASERFVLEMPDGIEVTTGNAYPDAAIIQASDAMFRAAETGIATAPLRMATVMPESVRHVTVEIRDRADRRLVTAIEVISPTNKRGDGYNEYLAKRQRILLSTAHLLEIDLLREGRRVPMKEPLPPAPYFVFLSRSDDRPMTEVWAIAGDQRLPEVPVPLLPGDPDVPLDLQAVFSAVYDQYGLDLSVDYRRPPEIPFGPNATSWVDECLRRAGLRT
jgi:hypothetical protein